MSEGEIQEEVIDYLRSTGFWTMRVNSGRRGGVTFYFWKMPENWTPYVSQDDIIDIFGEDANVQRILGKLIDDAQSDAFLDILAIKPGLPLVIVDTKSLAGQKRKRQRLMVRILRRLGCISGFVRSVDETHQLIMDWSEAEAETQRANGRPAMSVAIAGSQGRAVAGPPTT